MRDPRIPHLPKPSHWKGSQKKWDSLSPYLQRKYQTPVELRAFRTHRTPEHLANYRESWLPHKGWRQNGTLPPGVPKFYQLPPERRAEAEAYEQRLCEKWKDRIRVQPNFKNLLHMIAVNQFKNPGQSRRAVGASRQAHKEYKRVKRALFAEPAQSTSIHHLDLGLT